MTEIVNYITDSHLFYLVFGILIGACIWRETP